MRINHCRIVSAVPSSLAGTLISCHPKLECKTPLTKLLKTLVPVGCAGKIPTHLWCTGCRPGWPGGSQEALCPQQPWFPRVAVQEAQIFGLFPSQVGRNILLLLSWGALGSSFLGEIKAIFASSISCKLAKLATQVKHRRPRTCK